MISKHEFSAIRIPIEKDNPAIVRNEELCIKCGQCRKVCEEEIAVGRMYDLAATNDTAVCIHCGQCANVCPVNSISEVDDTYKIKQAMQDPSMRIVVSTSPSVRVALGEGFGMPAGTFVEGLMVAALRSLGFHYVLDTNFSADLTIMEEAAELVKRISTHGTLPQFTSCCPAWVKFVETFYPEMRDHLSSAKSPIGMQGPTIKTYFAQKQKLAADRIFNVALTPCTAKKFEIGRPEMNAAAAELDDVNLRDMDAVITTRELARWLKAEGIDLNALKPSEYDSFMGPASGAGIIFGNTGGVMEAAIRTAYWMLTDENPKADLVKLTPVRGMDGIREAELEINGIPVRAAVVHGTENARQLMEKIKAKAVNYDFVEVMTCRGGCIGGGGQPKSAVPMNDEIRQARIDSLYQKDADSTIRFSHENPQIQAVYKEFYLKPLSEKAERFLHTEYVDRSAILNGVHPKVTDILPKAEPASKTATRRFKCMICGYVAEMDELPEDYKCPICFQGREMFEEIKTSKPEAEPKPQTVKRRFKCMICGYVAEMDELPENYKCPICFQGREMFEEIV